MRTRIALALSLLLAGCGAGMGGDAYDYTDQFTDQDVARIYGEMMAVLAPDEGWERARYLEFDWAIGNTVRHHRWDRWNGDVRYEVETGGQTLVAIFNTNDLGAGRVWMDGTELTGEELETRLASAYRAHINDSYWLVMPFKWTDPGVVTSYLGEETDDTGRRWEVVQIAFSDGTGLTPQNMYHAFIDPETNRMERWHHFSEPTADPSPSDWTDWRMVGPIQLAENRRSGGQVRIHFPHMVVDTEVPEGAFDPPTG